MPLFNENKDIVSFVAGEITPDVDSVKALSKRGHDFIEGNLSFLPHLYEERVTISLEPSTALSPIY
jgi:hypothetical protein